jgi:magnesium-transporting ATPase (P-type)
LEIEDCCSRDSETGGRGCIIYRRELIRYVHSSPLCEHADDIADPPIKDIHTFYGVLNLRSTEPGVSEESSTPLSVDNVLWANTVLAAGSAIGLVVYTGKETRAVLNTSEPETKMGTLENEVNKMAKVS